MLLSTCQYQQSHNLFPAQCVFGHGSTPGKLTLATSGIHFSLKPPHGHEKFLHSIPIFTVSAHSCASDSEAWSPVSRVRHLMCSRHYFMVNIMVHFYPLHHVHVFFYRSAADSYTCDARDHDGQSLKLADQGSGDKLSHQLVISRQSKQERKSVWWYFPCR